MFLVKPESNICIIPMLEQESQKHEHAVRLSLIAYFSCHEQVFFSFQIKQENTDWMTRMEKARVS